MTNEEFDRLLAQISLIDADLAAHLAAAKECKDRPGPLNLKLAAHAIREFNLIYPEARGVEPPRRRRRDTPGRAAPGVVVESDRDAATTDPSAAADADPARRDSGEEMPADDPDHGVCSGGDEDALAKMLLRALALNDPTGLHARNLPPTAALWNRLQKWFVGRCHYRKGLARLEDQRPEFETKWSRLLGILHSIHGPILTVLPELQVLGRQDPSSPGASESIQALISKPEAFRRFLVEYAGAQWFSFLNAQGYFESPYEPVVEGDIISFPPWPQSQYMARIAASCPNEIAEFILRRGGDIRNALIQIDLVAAAVAMPPDVAARLVTRFGRWLQRGVSLRVPFQLGDLCVRLATGGQHRAALRLLSLMLSCNEPSSGGADHFRRVNPRLNPHAYEMILKQCEAALLPTCGLELHQTLVRQLRAVVHAEHGAGYDDYSWMWADDLGAEEDFSDGIAEALVAAVVRVARRHLESHPEDLGDFLGHLAVPPQAIFRRLQLFLLAEIDPSSRPALDRLIDRAIFDDPLARIEYRLLLSEAWEYLAQADQEMILAWILAGPSQQDDDVTDQAMADREAQRTEQKETWQYYWLKPIAGSISGEARDLYESLSRTRSAERAPRGFRRFSWVGPTSPLASDELRAMSPKEVISYLRAWIPAAEMMTPSPEGLARELVEVIKARREEWSGAALEFQRGLDLAYVRALFEGLADEHGGETTLDWLVILELCEHIVGIAAPTAPSEPGAALSRHSEVLRAMATLLQRALRGQLGLRLEHRARVWGVIERLAHDADPEPMEHERLRGRLAEPEVIALNSVRGVAMHAAVEYALWVARMLKSEGRTPNSWFEEVPEVRALFDEKLDVGREPCGAIPSVLAHYLPNLLYLDREWLRASVDRMFGGLGDAWEVYLLFGQVHLGVVPMLYESYLGACRGLGSESANERTNDLGQALAVHVLLLNAYCAEVMPGFDELLEAFFEHASPELRSHFLGQAGWHVEGNPEIGAKPLERIMAVVERRVRIAAASSSTAESAELSNWEPLCRASAFPDAWVAEMAKLALRASPGVAADLWLPERTGKIADTDLASALELLLLAASRPLMPLGLHNWTEPATKIIRLAVAQGGNLRETAREVVNQFSERGYSGYEGLLDGDGLQD
ncbi:MAG: hypothetical protein HZA61_01810 [Candidatus Eisenbacteria bacterium]|uniref:Uncharacterized protein n=1 Tax=Eiseniibacteriota bacterium TaxID=2212470 RepID=A0A933SB48_UNCEI|nr:hypothetical protein [Candidatus Eisenbacteria bacterium]